MAKDLPTSRVSRAAKVGRRAGGEAARGYATKAATLTRGEDGREAAAARRQMEAAEQIFDVLGQMKGAAMKVGQVASFIDTGAFPPEFQERIQSKLAELRDAAPRVSFDKMRKVVEAELDYEHEAQQHRAFARTWRGHPFIYVPAVVTDLSTEHVLVTEWVDGIGFEEVKELDRATRDRFGEIVFRFFFGSLYRNGHFSGDPHPGNYRLMPDRLVHRGPRGHDRPRARRADADRLRRPALAPLAAHAPRDDAPAGHAGAPHG